MSDNFLADHESWRAMNAIPADHRVISAYVPKALQAKLKAEADRKGVSTSVLAGRIIAAHLGNPDAAN